MFRNVTFYKNWKTVIYLRQITHLKPKSIIIYQLYEDGTYEDETDRVFRNVGT